MSNAVKGKLVHRLDSIQINDTYFTEEGYLMDMPIVTTTGIFEYTNPDGSIRRELRLPENVFEPESLASYKGKPIIVTHNAGVVDSTNVHDEIIGTILSEGVQSGDSVKAQICIHDTETMKRCGLKELSLGYSLETDETPGVWNGQPYDAIQKNIRINHLALVGTARAGETARLNIDSKEEILKGGKAKMVMSREELKEAIENFNKQAREDGTVEVTIPEELLESGQVKVKEVEGGEVEPAGVEPPTTEEPVVSDSSTGQTPQAAGGITMEALAAALKPLMDLVQPQNADAACTQVKEQKQVAQTQSQTEPVAQSETVKEEENNDGCKKKEDINMDGIDQRVDSIVAEKMDICLVGEKLGLNLRSKSIVEGKKEIIAKVEPNMHLDGASDECITGMYAMAKAKVESMKSTDIQRTQMFNNDGKQPDDNKVKEQSAASARERMIKKMGGEQ